VTDTRTTVKRTSEILDHWIRAPVAVAAGLSLAVSQISCVDYWASCNGSGLCAQGTTVASRCSTVVGVHFEPWAVALVALASTISLFGGIHQL